MPHTAYEELQTRIQNAESKVKIGGLYYHWRNPNQHYRLIGIGIDEATEGLVVIYEVLVEPKPITWTRRLTGKDGWLTPVTHEGVEVPRFRQVID